MFVFFSLFEAYTWFGWEVCGVVVGFGVFFGGLYIYYIRCILFFGDLGGFGCVEKKFFSGLGELLMGKNVFFVLWELLA